MTKEQLMMKYKLTSDEMKNDFVEWVTICNYMDEQDFNNLFRLVELNEEEFFRIIDFLLKQECFNILFMLMARHMNRFNHEDWGPIQNIGENTIMRLNRLKEFVDFKIPGLLLNSIETLNI